MTNTKTVPSLFDLIRSVESPRAHDVIRFEPLVYKRFENPAYENQHAVIMSKIKRFNQCSDATARMIFSTSWGEAQIMGFNIYDICKFQSSIYLFLQDILQQQIAFNAFVSYREIRHRPEELADSAEKRARFARIYNGSTAYEIKLLQALRLHGLEVK
jgi:hypothetical protein